jgi:hypothetical protein
MAVVQMSWKEAGRSPSKSESSRQPFQSIRTIFINDEVIKTSYEGESRAPLAVISRLGFAGHCGSETTCNKVPKCISPLLKYRRVCKRILTGRD